MSDVSTTQRERQGSKEQQSHDGRSFLEARRGSVKWSAVTLLVWLGAFALFLALVGAAWKLVT